MALLSSDLKKPGPLTSPARQFGEQMTRFYKMKQIENVMLSRDLIEAWELVHSRKRARRTKWSHCRVSSCLLRRKC